MKSKNNVTLFVVDDDPIYLRLVEIELIQYLHFKIESYATGEI
jgi:hypothetical protein